MVRIFQSYQRVAPSVAELEQQILWLNTIQTVCVEENHSSRALHENVLSSAFQSYFTGNLEMRCIFWARLQMSA